MAGLKDDTHFYIDNAPPETVRWALQSLRREESMTATEIFRALASDGKVTDKPRMEWLRRLRDLGLARQARPGSERTYILTPLGAKVQQIQNIDAELYPDVMHFLHFSSFDKTPGSRKYLWSYRQCSSLAWTGSRLLAPREIAAAIQDAMKEDFPDLDYQARVGARFDATAAGRWLRWIRTLRPCPFPEHQDTLRRRIVARLELALLALDDLYRTRGYRYGDPVVLEENTLDAIAAVFFLDPVCCRELIDMAARLTRVIDLADTFAGTSVTLREPYGIERI